MDYKIRAAKTADIPTILIIIQRLAEFDLPPKRAPEVFWQDDAKLLKQWADGNAPKTFVHVAAATDGEILGVTMVTMREELFDHSPSAHLEVLAVAKTADGRGIGKKLLANAETEAQQRGATSMSLHVVANNHRARHVYKHVGFDEELIRCIKHFDDSEKWEVESEQ